MTVDRMPTCPRYGCDGAMRVGRFMAWCLRCKFTSLPDIYTPEHSITPTGYSHDCEHTSLQHGADGCNVPGCLCAFMSWDEEVYP